MTHNFTQVIQTKHYEIKLSPTTDYGYFERNSDGSGGGLWFDHTEYGHELIDFDGMYELPRQVIAALREVGYYLDSTFDPD